MQAQIAVRAYVPLEEEELSTFRPVASIPQLDLSRVLVFDTETTIDRFQNLKFGSFSIYQYDRQILTGIFYDSKNVCKKELDVLVEYRKAHNIMLMTVHDFITRIFLPEVYDVETLCVGFNLPFDLSRIAINFGFSRGTMNGGFSFTLAPGKKYPGLAIKHIDGSKAFIRFTNSIDPLKRKKGFRGNFLDLHTLVQALTGDNHSLESACKLFGSTIRKGKANEHGKITCGYIDYNRQDVDATYSLYLKAKKEFDLYDFGDELPITKVYSPASIGKACFKKMHIKPFRVKNAKRISNEVLGCVTTTYIGARSEVRIRKSPTLVTVLDFLSMYPSMCILLQLWDFIICDHIDQQECTEEVREFLQTLRLEDFKCKEIFGKLNVIVQVVPDCDILPIRAKFDKKETYNVGDCYVKSANGEKLWYTLADVANSRIRTGRMPTVVRAIRFIPIGKQQGLEPIGLFGKEVNPYKDNLFQIVIEQRKHVQQQQKICQRADEKEFLDKKQKALKLIANATSYGIFMEINTEEQEAEVTAYGIETIHCRVTKVELSGKQNNPFVATFITSGARLILGIVEALLATHGAIHAFCDTDSMAVPPKHSKEIQDFFIALNPYSFDAPLFKVEYENVLFYGISAKRYVLYRIDKATHEINIVKASSHGLGHLLNPLKDKGNLDHNYEGWREQVWLDILSLHYNRVLSAELTAKYENAFAMSKLAISTPNIFRRFDRLNAGQPYYRQIKPFNFCIVGIGNSNDKQTGKVIKPLSPYRKDVHLCPYEEFVDYKSTCILKGRHYWRRFSDILWKYLNHPEAKFDGDTNVLKRKTIDVKSVCHIGKESNNLEIAEVIGVQQDDYVFYSNKKEEISKYQGAILAATPKDVKRFGITRNELWYARRSIASGNSKKLKGKTIDRLLSYAKSLKPDGILTN